MTPGIVGGFLFRSAVLDYPECPGPDALFVVLSRSPLADELRDLGLPCDEESTGRYVSQAETPRWAFALVCARVEHNGRRDQWAQFGARAIESLELRTAVITVYEIGGWQAVADFVRGWRAEEKHRKARKT